MNTIYSKLFELQQEYKSSKDSRNNFGGYNYRNYETMLTTLKPMLAVRKLILIAQEDLLDCQFMKCTLQLIDVESGEKIETHSISKIDDSLKGMSQGQMAGAVISYLRKYTLQGLLGIDDGKDLDSLEPQQPKKSEDKIASILDQINECSTKEELKTLWDKLGNWTKNQTVKTAFTARKKII